MSDGMWRRAPLLFVAGALAACPKRSESEKPPPPAPPPPVAVTSAEAAPPASAAPSNAGPYNVVLLSIDSLRADMPWAGYERPIAPNLGKLHARAISFDRAYAVSSFTSKSVAGMLTGRYPSELKRTGVFFTKYLDEKDFFCTELAAAGVRCVAGHAHAYMGKGQSGFESGFASWRLVDGIAFDYNTDPYVTSQKLTPLAIETLDEAANRPGPFFAWFHYMDPHDQYQGHEESPHFGKRARDLYDEEVFYTDLWIGKLLAHIEAQPWAARTVVAVTADHGEAFGEHGMWKHAHEVWEELVHVPMFFVVPGVAPRKISAPRSHVDLAPTILELLGQKSSRELPGKSLVGELRGGEAEAREVIVDLPEDKYNERRRALIRGRHKLIAFGNDVRFSLYDLEADPGEKNDLFRTEKALAAELREAYREASKRVRDTIPVGGIPKP